MTTSPLPALTRAWRALTGVELHFDSQPDARPRPFKTQLTYEGEVLGELSLDETPSGLTADQTQAWLELCGRLLSAALGEKRAASALADEVISAWNQLTFLYEILKVNSAVSAPGDMAATLSELACKVFQCENAFLAYTVGSGLAHRSAAALEPAEAEAYFDLVQREPAVVLRNDDTPTFLGVRVPLTAGGRAAIGLIGSVEGAFNAGDRQLAESLAEQIGTVMDNITLQRELTASLRLKQELEIAARIQANLLPAQLPQLAGVDLAGYLLPASRVGGDFYDVVKLGDGDVGVMLCDVAGKGIPAAMLTTLVHATLRGQLLAGATPGVVLSRTNEVLQPDLERLETFATALVLRLYSESHAVGYASAGHTTSLWWQAANRTAVGLSSTALPLGIVSDMETAGRSLEVQPGDVIVLYSDGVTEAENAEGKVFGQEGLSDVLFAAHAAPAAAVLQAVLDAVLMHRGSQPPNDDLTLLIIKRAAPDPAQAYEAFVLSAELSQIARIDELFLKVLGPLAAEPRLETWRHEVGLALAELAANIIRHAYAGQAGRRLHGLFRLYADKLVMEFVDSGRPFESAGAPVLDFDPANPPEGGYGIPILHAVMDRVHYERTESDRNIWRLERRLP